MILRKQVMFVLRCLFAALPVPVLVSCGGFITELDESEIPLPQPKIAVECMLSPQSAMIEVVVTRTRPILGEYTTEPVYIPSATVILSDENREVTIPYNDSASSYLLDAAAFRIMAGGNYRLVVRHEGEMVHATCTVPASIVKVSSYDIDSSGSAGYGQVRMRMTLTDVPREVNYYMFRAHFTVEANDLTYLDGMVGPQVIRTRSNLLVNFPDRQNLVSDVRLDGLPVISPSGFCYLPPPYTSTYIDGTGEQKPFHSDPRLVEIVMDVLNVDENYYRFQRSLENNDNSNPFVEPSLLYTNINGGVGYFGGYTRGSTILQP